MRGPSYLNNGAQLDLHDRGLEAELQRPGWRCRPTQRGMLQPANLCTRPPYGLVLFSPCGGKPIVAIGRLVSVASGDEPAGLEKHPGVTEPGNCPEALAHGEDGSSFSSHLAHPLYVFPLECCTAQDLEYDIPWGTEFAPSPRPRNDPALGSLQTIRAVPYEAPACASPGQSESPGFRPVPLHPSLYSPGDCGARSTQSAVAILSLHSTKGPYLLSSHAFRSELVQPRGR